MQTELSNLIPCTYLRDDKNLKVLTNWAKPLEEEITTHHITQIVYERIPLFYILINFTAMASSLNSTLPFFIFSPSLFQLTEKLTRL